MTRDLRQALARTGANLRQVIEVVDRSASAVALLVDDQRRLVGLLTDGDIRRALLAGATLEDDALPFASTSPQTVEAGSSRALVLDLMRALRITAVPELDADGVVVGLHTLSDVVGVEPLPNAAVIMAGGRGSRLGQITQRTPKPLMEVAGRTILEWIVLNLVGGGVREIWVSVNYMAEQIQEHLGDGSHLGCSIRYLREDPERPLGTAGSLAMLREQKSDVDTPLLVMNGDLMVQFEAPQLLGFHERASARVTVATRPYRHQVPFGVVDTSAGGTAVEGIREKPTFSAAVNAGVYVLEPDVLGRLRPGAPLTMPELIQDCLDSGEKVAAWELPSDWIDVGTPVDLARAKGQL